MNLLKNVKFTRVANDAVAGTATVTSSVLDMQGFDGVMFIALLGDITVTSVLQLNAKGNTINATSGSPATLASTASVTAGATDNDNGVYIVDVYKPTQRYVFATLTRGTANAVVDGILAIQYCAGKKPTTQDVTTILQTAFAVGA